LTRIHKLDAEEQVLVCEQGHKYRRKGTCRVCPKCERMKSIPDGFLKILSAPARRAMEANGITDLTDLSNYTLHEIAAWHGVGKTTLMLLSQEMTKNKLEFKVK